MKFRPNSIARLECAVVLIRLLSNRAPALAQATLPDALSPATVRDALAVNIHFTTPRPGEMDLLAACGFGRVRMDIAWQKIEKTKGVYDFSEFDGLMRELEAKQIKAMLILDYGNALYTGDKKTAPITPEARAAFARYAAAVVNHFKGRGVLWEIYNEPNNKEFWQPKPDGRAYAELVEAASDAIRAVAPDETLCGPGLALIDLPFLDRALDAGLLKHLDAITVHPYRATQPETFGDDLSKVRSAIERHAPAGKSVPVIAGEWGYPIVWVDATTRVNYAAREMLYDLSQRLPLTVWYDWRRGGGFEGQLDIFGLIDATPDGHGGMTLRPNAVYDGVAALTHLLGDTHFTERLPLTPANEAGDFLLAFDGAHGRRYASWTTADKPKSLTARLPEGTYDIFDVWGQAAGRFTAKEGFKRNITGSPVYLVPVESAATQPATAPAH